MAERGAFLQAGSYSAEDLRQEVAAGWVSDGVALSLKPKGGVVPGYGGQLAVTANGTPNMTVNVATGRALVPGTTSALQAGYMMLVDAIKSVAITAANGSNPRKDLIIARVQDAAYAGAVNTFTVEVVTGTPAASPVAPALPASSLLLAEVLVGTAVTSITNPNITDKRVFAATLSGAQIISGAAARPASPAAPQLCFRQDTGRLEMWNGTAWITLVGADTVDTLTNKAINTPVITSATLSGTATGAGNIQLTGVIQSTQVIQLVNGAREIIMGYAGSGGLSIGNNGGATHPNGMVLWANASNLFCRKPSGADTTVA